MSETEAAEYCEKVGAKSVLPRIIKTGYSALGLVHYFTASANEVRAWSVKKDTPAPKAAAVIHGDFEKHFISSDIYTFADFKELGSEANVRAAGKLRAEGRKYEVQDGDSAWREGCARARARGALLFFRSRRLSFCRRPPSFPLLPLSRQSATGRSRADAS